MSQLEVDKIVPQSGTTLTIGDSGDTINFADGQNINIDSNTLYIDSTNNRVGIGTSSPDELLSLEKSNAPKIQYKDTSGGTDAKVWRTMGLDSDYRVETRSDNLSNGQLAYSVTRSGYVVNEHKFFTSDSERMRITSAGNVGIGTSSPSPDYGSDNILEIAGSTNPGLVINDTGQASKYSLHAVSADFVMMYGTTAFFRYKPGDSQITAHDNLKIITGTSSGVTPNTIADKLFIDGVGNQGLTIGSGNTSVGSVVFADDGDNDIGKLQYNHSDNSMGFTVNASEAMRIDSSGNFMVGKTTSNYTSPGVEAKSNGNLIAVRDSGNVVNFVRNTNDGSILTFAKDTTNFGSIGVKDSNNLFIDGLASNHCGIEFDGGSYIPRRNSATADNLIDLGTSSTRFAHLYLGGGVFLGGTGSANELDDYEEGTFTPTVTGATSGSFTTGDGATKGSYVKIGNQVTVRGEIHITGSSSPVGAVRVGNLPFACAALTELSERTTGSCWVKYMDLESTTRSLVVFISQLNSYFQFYEINDNANVTAINSAEVTAPNAEFAFCLTYQTA